MPRSPHVAAPLSPFPHRIYAPDRRADFGLNRTIARSSVQAWIILILALAVVGCTQKRSTRAGDSKSFSTVQEIVAAQLKVDTKRVTPEATFSSLGADELDLVEIVMATEEKLNVSISDESLGRAAGSSKTDKIASQLTVGALVNAAVTAPEARRRSPKLDEPDDGSLRLSQVGPYAKLSKLPNPRGHELVFIPDLPQLLASTELSLSRKLTHTEQADLKAGAAVIAMSADDAAKLRGKRDERKLSHPQ